MPNRRTPHLSVTHGVGQNRTEPDISGQPDIVGQKRVVACSRVCRRIACGTVGRGRTEPVPDRVRYRRSRAHGAGAGSCAVPSVAGARSRCRTRRGGWSSCAVSPVVGSRAVRPVARSHVIMSLPVSATSVSLPCPRSGIPQARHLPCPGPTWPVADAAFIELSTPPPCLAS